MERPLSFVGENPNQQSASSLRNQARLLRIAVVDVIPDTSHAFSSMLRIIGVRTGHAWELVNDPSDADVVVTEFGTQNAQLVRWKNFEKRFIALVGPNKVRPLMRYTLGHPFRAAEVEAVLNELACDLGNARPKGIRENTQEPAEHEWAFSKALSARAHSANETAWYCARTNRGDLFWVSGDLSCYAAKPQLIAELRSGKLVFESFLGSDTNPPADLPRRPAFELLWLATFNVSDALAPWLRSNAEFRLRHWPDFGLVRVPIAVMQISARLSSHSCTRADLSSRFKIPPQIVNKTLNAMSMCGLLIVGSPRVESGHVRLIERSPQASGFVRSFVAGLRKRLGLGG